MMMPRHMFGLNVWEPYIRVDICPVWSYVRVTFVRIRIDARVDIVPPPHQLEGATTTLLGDVRWTFVPPISSRELQHLREESQTKSVTKSGKSPKGGKGSALKTKKSTIQNIDFLIRGGESRFSGFYQI